MLVLTRKKNTSILIGDRVVLIVRSIAAEEVVLHVFCPPDLPVRTTGFAGQAHDVPKLEAHAPPLMPQAVGPWSLGVAQLRTDQSLQIGQDVHITIEGLHFTDGLPNRVRLGITAPREIPILRDEVLAKQMKPHQPEGASQDQSTE